MGGKGASLGEMLKAGFPIPPGFCITAQAYREFHNESFPESVREEIYDHYECLGTERVAVRSSALAEDSTAASWAGQLESFLNVTKVNLIEAIVKCWQSIDSPRAKAYAASQNISEDDKAVAVVIQKMVNAQVSGVMFTTNPITKNDKEMMIESAFGLGESIVQGLVTPDNFIVGKSPLALTRGIISTKSKQLIYQGGETLELETNAGDANTSSLTDNQVLAIARLGVRLEEYYHCPQDVEWAIEDGNIFIVQSRPITTLG